MFFKIIYRTNAEFGIIVFKGSLFYESLLSPFEINAIFQ